MWGCWWERSAARVGAGIAVALDEEDGVTALRGPRRGRHRVGGVLSRRDDHPVAAAVDDRGLEAVDRARERVGVIAGDVGRCAGSRARAPCRRGSTWTFPAGLRARGRERASASSVALGRSLPWVRSTGACSGALMSTAAAMPACHSPLVDQRDHVGAVELGGRGVDRLGDARGVRRRVRARHPRRVLGRERREAQVARPPGPGSPSTPRIGRALVLGLAAAPRRGATPPAGRRQGAERAIAAGR